MTRTMTLETQEAQLVALYRQAMLALDEEVALEASGEATSHDNQELFPRWLHVLLPAEHHLPRRDGTGLGKQWVRSEITSTVASASSSSPSALPFFSTAAPQGGLRMGLGGSGGGSSEGGSENGSPISVAEELKQMRASLAAIHQQLQQQAQAQAQVVVMAQSVEPPAPKRMATLPRAAPLVPVDM